MSGTFEEFAKEIFPAVLLSQMEIDYKLAEIAGRMISIYEGSGVACIDEMDIPGGKKSLAKAIYSGVSSGVTLKTLVTFAQYLGYELVVEFKKKEGSE